MGGPFISVVITAYNRREYLKHAVKSVINQTLNKGLYEIIVVKNFRDSEIDKLIESNRGRIIEAGNEPVGRYLARGIDESEGEVISFLDDDDVYHSRKLERLYKVFNENKGLDYYHHNVIPIDRNGKIIAFDTANIYDQITVKGNDYNAILRVIRQYKFGMGSYMSAIALRKDIASMLARYILPRVIFAQDLITYVFTLRYGKLLIHEPYPLVYYRLHSMNVSKVFEHDLRRICRMSVFTIVAVRHQIPRILTFNIEDSKLTTFLKRAAEDAIEVVFADILSSIIMNWKYHIAKYSLKGLISGLRDGSIYRIAAATVGFIYLINPYVARKIIQWRYFGNKHG